MSKLTNSQKVAYYILGYVPKGFTCAVSGSLFYKNQNVVYQSGHIYVDGKCVVSIPTWLHGGELPTVKKLGL